MSYVTTKVTVQTATESAKAARDAIKDAGRVHVGGALIQFDAPAAPRDNVKDKGRTHVDGGFMRF
jgi:hypothetical protein